MVLEHVIPEAWLERRSWSAFFLGGLYSILGIIIARILFPVDPALPAVAFTSIFVLPELYTLFSIEEREQERDLRSDVKAFWRDNGDFYRVLLFLFLGVLVVYSIGSMLLASFSVNTLFREQLAMRAVPGFGAAGSTGAAVASATGAATGAGTASMVALFTRLLWNNALVFVAVFVVALLAGDGAIFLLLWNASVWGTIFGVTARNAAYVTHGDPFLLFVQVLATVTPHMLLEASAYILAAMAGGLLSRALLKDGLGSRGLREVVADNTTVILLALGCLLLGCAVESFVLTHSTSYADIVRLSLLGA